MKTTKLSLETLQVKSFVTNMKEEKLNTVQGGKAHFTDVDFCTIGYTITQNAYCPIDVK